MSTGLTGFKQGICVAVGVGSGVRVAVGSGVGLHVGISTIVFSIVGETEFVLSVDNGAWMTAPHEFRMQRSNKRMKKRALKVTVEFCLAWLLFFIIPILNEYQNFTPLHRPQG